MNIDEIIKFIMNKDIYSVSVFLEINELYNVKIIINIIKKSIPEIKREKVLSILVLNESIFEEFTFNCAYDEVVESYILAINAFPIEKTMIKPISSIANTNIPIVFLITFIYTT